MAGTRNRRERNKTERRESRSHTKVEVTKQYKRAEIISRPNTIFNKIPSETFGKNGQTEKIVDKE